MPADKRNVATVVASMGNMRDKAFRSLGQLPPFSPTLNRLLAMLADEDVSFAQLAGVIEKDTVLAGHVLRLVNSALYAHSGTINSVRHAVSILGLVKLRNTALSLSVARMWTKVRTPKSFPMARFNLHSVGCAVMGDLVAQRAASEYPEGAFTAGLLHAVGKLLLAVGLPEEYDLVLACFEAGAPSMEDAEREIVGFCHAELAAAAMAQWKLPAPIQLAVGLQDTPEPARDGRMSPSGLLHLSHKLVNTLDVKFPACACHGRHTPASLLEDTPMRDQTEPLLTQFHSEFDSLRAFF